MDLVSWDGMSDITSFQSDFSRRSIESSNVAFSAVMDSVSWDSMSFITAGERMGQPAKASKS
jgi:hypothetical protein